MSGHKGHDECWIIGGGRMGQAFLAGLRKLDRSEAPGGVVLVDPDPAARERAERVFSAHAVARIGDLEDRARKTPPSLVFFAVKPGLFPEVAESVRSWNITSLGVSVMAGVPLSGLERRLPGWRWVRTMSNLALTRGEGMTVLAGGKGADSQDISRVSRIFLEMGRVMMLPESQFDVATALAGSGPGIMALVLDALSDAGVRHGLKRDDAVFLAAQMMKGTASLILDEGMGPSDLKGRVSSPSGTTIEGLLAMERKGVRGALMEAVEAMVSRSRDLGRASEEGGEHSSH